MPAKIRLTRQGRKRKPFYHIVIADSRAPRDGRFIERIGIYDPNTNPATIELDFDSALNWLQNGAQPTDTCRAILSFKGVIFKNHLLNGVKKGAFSEEEAENRFQTWLKEKEGKVQAKIDQLLSAQKDAEKEIFEAETKINEARAEEIAKRQSALAEEAELAEKKASEPEEVVEEEVAVEAATEPAAETTVEETVVETEVEKPEVTEEVKVEAEVVEAVTEAAAETAVEETLVETEVEKPEVTEEAEVVEEVKAEVAEEKVEEKKEDKKAEEKKEDKKAEEKK
ncbi:MAG: 30S ribosomal protein S16 [Bacteroidales bacterium]|nr:30S ribosomal protein S16 [Bacteroidales bacterium]